MPATLPDPAWIELGLGAVSLVVVVYLAVKGWRKAARQDADNRKRTFSAAMRVLRFDCASASDSDLVATHQKSLTGFKKACLLVVKDIPADKRAVFKAAADDYLHLSPKEIENRDENAKPPPLNSPHGYTPGNVIPWKAPCRYDRPRILRLLDTLIDCAQ